MMRCELGAQFVQVPYSSPIFYTGQSVAASWPEAEATQHTTGAPYLPSGRNWVSLSHRVRTRTIRTCVKLK